MREPIMLAAPVQAYLTVYLSIEELERIGREMLKYIYASIVEVFRHKEAYEQELKVWENKNRTTSKFINDGLGFFVLEDDKCLDEQFACQLRKRGLPLISAHAVGHILQAIVENPNSHLWSS